MLSILSQDHGISFSPRYCLRIMISRHVHATAYPEAEIYYIMIIASSGRIGNISEIQYIKVLLW